MPEEGYTTYRDVADEVSIFTAHQSYVLGTLGLHEDELGNPLLPAVVVRSQDPPMVGDQYFRMVEKTSRPEDIPDAEPARRRLWQDHVTQVREHWREAGGETTERG